METKIISAGEKISRKEIEEMAADRFRDRVKAVVDIESGDFALDGEMNSDQESVLLQNGSSQINLWGINLYHEKQHPDWIEFDSMINIRPNQGNRSRYVEDEKVRTKIISIIKSATT